MLRNSGVVPLQFRDPKPGLGEHAGRNLSEELVVIRVSLFEYGDRARGAREIDAAGRGVIEDFVSPADTVEHLYHLSRVRVHDNQFPRFALVPAQKTAPKEQAMMCRVQTGNVRLRTSGDRP